MRFHVRVGILPHERDLPQPLAIDLQVAVGPGSLVDYRALHALVVRIVDGEPLEYLETIATTIGDAAIALGGVRAVRIAVRKPHVALPGPLGCAEIVYERTDVGGPAAPSAPPSSIGPSGVTTPGA